jgi:hypothetical protein
MDALADALIRRGFETTLKPVGEPIRAGIIVCDSDQTRADDRSLYRAERIIAVDLATRDLDVDLLVDPTPSGRPEHHRRARCIAIGARFALVDPSICDYPVTVPQPVARRVLVASDDAAMARQLARGLPQSDVWLASDRRRIRRVPGVHVVPYNLSEVAAADVVVAADDVTFAEAMALGRPTIAIGTAPPPGQLDESGAVIVARASVLEAVIEVIGDELERHRMFENGRRLIDGLGAARVADEVVRLVSVLV